MIRIKKDGVAASVDLHDDVPVAEAADSLGVSSLALRQRIRRGEMVARRRAGRWFVPLAEIDRLGRVPSLPGRPYEPKPAWELVNLASGHDPSAGLSAARVSQLRRALLDVDDIDELLVRLRRRADRRLSYVHPGLLPDVLDDHRVFRGGLSALPRDALDLVADHLPAEAYVAATDLSDLIADYSIVDAVEVANLVLHVVDEPPVLDGLEELPDLVVAIDLFESGDPRAQSAARNIWRAALGR